MGSRMPGSARCQQRLASALLLDIESRPNDDCSWFASLAAHPKPTVATDGSWPPAGLNASDLRSNPLCHFILVIFQEMLDQVLAVSILSVHIGARLDQPPEKLLVAE